ncbi:MAG: 5-(carboxyamino)imidazole ribonucleotide synthase [Alphaproteobacteria bacterium]|nr:5-(carboxyamino)imidazole ribonucleotide synthase [Alphaproteobacteria bacterium]
MSSDQSIPPGGTIGILGGGQLGRMTALAAAQLGYRVHIFTPEQDSPASHVSDGVTIASFEDEAALDRFAHQVDVVTLEFENIPASPVRFLSERVPVRPGPRVLETAQDRLAEKRFFNELGINTAPWREVRSAEDLEAAFGEIGAPCVLKTARLGYDGKGQAKITSAADLPGAWAGLGTDLGILEGFISFDCEVSALVTRGLDGSWAAWDVVQNVHTNHILDTTSAPALLSQPVLDQAVAIAHRAAEALDLVGVLAVEMFLTRDGRLLVNEMAPRPHNSGHWTIDACLTSQFEQVVRAVCGLPLGTPKRHSDAVMTNLIGDMAEAWETYLHEPNAKLHLYGKAERRQGRKMGHVTRLYPLGRRPHS